MQNELKYRVWSKKSQRYIEFDEQNDNPIALAPDGKLVAYSSNFSMYKNKELSQNDYIVERCTGLNDKTGELIYAGDIVKIKDEIFFIRYEIGSFLIIRNQQSLDCWYEMFTECWNDDVYPLSQLWIDEYIQEDFIECLEIIGNINQNPELLGGGGNQTHSLKQNS